MSNPLQLPVLIAGLNTKVDGSIAIRLETRELTADAAGQLYGLRNQEAWALIAPDRIQEPNLPSEKPDPALSSKSPSQRLRSVIYVYWQQKGSSEDFEVFYKHHLEKIIEQFKERLE